MEIKLNTPQIFGPRFAKIKVWLFPVFSLLLVAGIGFLVLKPWWDDIQDKKTMIADYENRITIMVDKVNILNNYQAADLEKYLLELEIAVPRKALASNILAAIENEISTAEISLNSVQFAGIVEKEEETSNIPIVEASEEGGDPEEITPADIVDTAPVNNAGDIDVIVVVEGDYYKVVEFVNKINHIRPLMKIKSIQLRANTAVAADEEGEETTTTVTQQINLAITSPFAGLSENIGGESEPIQGLSEADLDLIEKLAEFSSLFTDGYDPEVVEYEFGRTNPF